MSETATSPGPFVVRAHGLSRTDLRIHLFSVLTVPLYTLILVFLTIGGPNSHFLLKVSLALVLAGALDLAFLEVASLPRSVRLSQAGVEVRYRVHREHRKWNEFEPEMKRAWGMWSDGGWWIFYRSMDAKGHPKRRRGYWLTDEQSRAIIAYPSGVHWSVDETFSPLPGGPPHSQ